MTAEKNQPRGRPRLFDTDAALAAGRRLFHAKGYTAVGLAMLTKELAIGPASFYAAFGSKAAFFDRILAAYSGEVLPLDPILRENRPVAEAMEDLLLAAARIYSEAPERAGCLVLESLRADAGDEGRAAAMRFAAERRVALEAFVAASAPGAAEAVTDLVTTTMAGLSAAARDGMPTARLEAVARLASGAIRTMLPP